MTSSPTTAAPARGPGSKLSRGVELRTAQPADGRRVWRLIEEVGGLERNTGYAYLLLCDHFADTTVVAESAEGLVGFVAAYSVPRRPDTVFVWQVGVHPVARGMGLGGALLDELVRRGSHRFLEATVTPDNRPSRHLFQSFAERHGAPFHWTEGYPASLFEPGHEPEPLIRVGPLPTSPKTPSSKA